MEKSKCGVHARHCCVVHGCKYGDEDCPVVLKEVDQEFTCEYCGEDGFQNVQQVQEYMEIKEQVKKAKEDNVSNLTVSVDFLDRLLNRAFL